MMFQDLSTGLNPDMSLQDILRSLRSNFYYLYTFCWFTSEGIVLLK